MDPETIETIHSLGLMQELLRRKRAALDATLARQRRVAPIGPHALPSLLVTEGRLHREHLTGERELLPLYRDLLRRRAMLARERQAALARRLAALSAAGAALSGGPASAPALGQ
jgi:hypothetical protein